MVPTEVWYKIDSDVFAFSLGSDQCAGDIKNRLSFFLKQRRQCNAISVCRFNHELVFGISVKNLSKAERLIYGDSLMTHAMILTAVTDKVRTHKHSVSTGV